MLQTFAAFQKAGCRLAELHLGYENVKPYTVTVNDGEELPKDLDPESERLLYRVEKMKHGTGNDDKPDLSKVHL